jgi:hypothetical protein
MVRLWSGACKASANRIYLRSKVYEWPIMMSGFGVYNSGGNMHDNLWQDILSSGNARYGLSFCYGRDR